MCMLVKQYTNSCDAQRKKGEKKERTKRKNNVVDIGIKNNENKVREDK